MYLSSNVPKDGTDAPTLVDVANDFVNWGERKSKANDIPNKFSVSSK